jgi:hypothetical protein
MESDMKSELKKHLETLTLERGQTKIIAVHNTKEKDQVQLLYAQHIDRNDTQEKEQDSDDFELDMLAYHMEGHESFVDRARLAWSNFMLDTVKKQFGEEAYTVAKRVAENDTGEKVFEPLDILNPTFEHPKLGTVYEKIKLVESHTPQGNDLEYLDKSLKQDGRGNFLYVQETFVDPEGNIKPGRKLGIFMDLRIAGVPEDPEHKGQGKEPKHDLITHTGKTKIMDEIDYLEEGEDFDPSVMQAYRSQKDLTSPKGDQEAPKEKTQEPEQV